MTINLVSMTIIVNIVINSVQTAVDQVIEFQSAMLFKTA